MQVTLEDGIDVAQEDRATARTVFLPRSRTRVIAAENWQQYTLFTVCVAVYLIPFVRLFWHGYDEGTLAYDAVRIIHGQVFARDFFEVIGPGTVYWLAAFYKLFGVSFFAERACLFVDTLGTALCMLYLSRQVCRRYWLLPPVLLLSTYFCALWPMVNHHVDSNFFGLLSVVCVFLWLRRRNSIFLFAAGALAAVTTLALQPKGVLLFAAFIAWLGIQLWRRSGFFSSIALLATGYFSVLVLALFYFWTHGALRDLISMNVLWPLHHYSKANAVAYGLGTFHYWANWGAPIHGVRWLAPFAILVIAPSALIAVLPILVPLLAIPKGKCSLRPEILLLWFSAWAMWLSEIHRRDAGHLTAGSPLLMVLCIYFLTEYRGRIANLSLQWIVITACALGVVNLFVVLSARPVSTRVGPATMFAPDPVLAFLSQHTRPGDDIFVYPYVPMYYFLSATTNPTPYSLLVYNYNTPSQFRQAIQIVDRKRVRYVVWDTSLLSPTAPQFLARNFTPVGGLLMEPYLKSHYRLVEQYGGLRILERIMERKDAPHADAEALNR